MGSNMEHDRTSLPTTTSSVCGMDLAFFGAIMARQLGAFAATLRGLCSASGRGAGSDEVVLRGLSFYARHGVLPAEAELGQNFVVDLKLGCCLQRAGTLDDVSSTVDYSAVYRVSSPPRPLIHQPRRCRAPRPDPLLDPAPRRK